MRKLSNNKKGIVFTLLAIVIAVFFTLTFSAKIQQPLDHRVPVIETRVNLLNNYMQNFFEYAEAMASISGYSALHGMVIGLDGNYTQNFETEYLNCIIKGNITHNEVCPGMKNHTLRKHLDKIKAMAYDELNIMSAYQINQINVTQKTDAFSLELTVNLSLMIIDNFANLSDVRVIHTLVSINGVPDPMYLINSSGTYNQIINKSPLKRKGGDWNSSDLQSLFYNHHYRSTRDGVSFLNRIKGNFSASLFGIESFVNHTHPKVIMIMGAYADNYSMVDYYFWNNKVFSCTKIAVVNRSVIQPPGFQINYDPHAESFFFYEPDLITPVCVS